jgi:mono/diheme cytochrome c family protein
MRSTMIRILLLSMTLGFFSSVRAETKKITFKDHGRDIRSLALNDFGSLTPKKSLTVWEPHEDKQVTYRGYPLVPVLNKVYGNAWQKAGLVLFVCADGYKAPVPRALLESANTLLAIERTDTPEFKVHNKLQNEKAVPLAPLYLVWDNQNNEQLKAEGASNWPYQVIGIEITDFAEKFPRMIPPSKASQAAKRGFLTFQKYCMTCHKINGDGGDKGGELNTLGSSAFDLRGRDWLVKWILDPRSLRAATTMPGLRENLPSRQKAANDIVSYLEVMKKHTAPPKN